MKNTIFQSPNRYYGIDLFEGGIFRNDVRSKNLVI